ncbi:type II CAAX endopeptidase family protein [Biformimicrobium ophioploci]|uniref:Type II CAAX endopeptidase family protein n=1 Tax=Biformimicrobium ophioploci TaxID=3036711 RepID=A0ABQ6LWZ3_9GAMM|nr:type II CAAX endopeptidase family protein [Microbulbifer sp. NKW57]GMG86634.1 type II CAAX endopeptidase family protein [Microbulbifer sp. NKW57]
MARQNNHSRELTEFFLLSFLIAWAVWIPILLGLLPAALVPFGFLGPIVAATTLTARNSGKAGLKSLYAGLLRFKVSWVWYIAILTPAAITTVTHLVFSFFFGFESFIGLDKIVISYLVIAVFLILEEVGWRGYALPRLLNGHSALKASLILGVVWAVWHFPFWSIIPIAGAPEPFFLFYITGTMGAVCMAVVLTWIYKNTGRSIALATLCHASFNATVGAITFDKSVAIYHNLILVVVAVLVAVLLVAIFGGKDLRRSRSGDDLDMVGAAN